ncbi:MAG: ASCH domain-containing protein [Bacillota bacterium]|nr:ASCH domain-containing protein [Bacillota bacterium]
MEKDVKKLLEEFEKSLKNGKENFEKAWHFCADEKNANELAELTLKGIKRGTASLKYWYEVEDERIPEAGDLNIITDWEGKPVCVIKNEKVSVIPFKDVDKDFAFREGEGDKSLKYWRDVHIDYFTKELKEVDKDFNEDMLVVCEEFDVVEKL